MRGRRILHHLARRRRPAVAGAIVASVAFGAPLREAGAQAGAPAPASPRARSDAVTPARLANPAAGEWLHNGRDYGNRRFSPLTQITTRNVARLAPRWLFQLDMPQPGAGAEGTPVVANGRMYVSTDYDVVTAFDLRTRHRLWRYAPTLGIAKPCCGPVNRGVALGHGLVFIGTLDSRLIALDAATGAVRWEAVNNDPDSAYSITMAPVVVDDRVIVGTSGGEFPTRGSVTAYDARTGRRLWRWYSIPSPEEGGWWGRWSPSAPTGESLHRDIAAERADSARYAGSWRTGGGPVWAQPAYDPASGTLYVTVGNPAPSNDGRRRPGDNLYTASVVALDAATGAMRWYFQAVPHDVWDSDLATPPVLARVGGRALLLVAGKTGWVYVLDAATGALVRRSEPFVPQQNLFVVPTKEGVVTAPGPFGGANWWPSSYSETTGLLYVPGTDWPFRMRRGESVGDDAPKGEVWIGGDYEPADTAVPPSGTLSAIRPSTGKIVWQRRTGVFGGGALVTAGGLVFAGDGDGWLHAYDAATGKAVWEFFCGAAVAAPPISFELDGTQYVAVVAAGNRYAPDHGAALLVFGVGAKSARSTIAGSGTGARREVAATAARGPDATAPPATPADGATTIPPSATRAGPFLAYDAERRVAWIRLDAGGHGAGALSFDGRTAGAGVFTVPAGWRVEVQFRNADAAPHSALVVRAVQPVPLTPGPAAFAGAASARPEVGLGAGAQDRFAFVASQPGSFLVACGVPGHATAGMFLR
ncbi:MAG TPA: PQQ-binding-like beta-propeller repeat protein, partial [Gemmatimonadaceae bacterium]|nr:PQQ-binding-like beta-propeller repeat protein [Gemmatimonadaceae bacterium]